MTTQRQSEGRWMTNILDFNERGVGAYVIEALEGFLNDPPDSDFQFGYLSALCAVYREALNGQKDARLIACERILKRVVVANDA